MNKKILVIDDESSVLAAYEQILSARDKDIQGLKKQASELESELFGSSAEEKFRARECYELTTASQGEQGYEKVRAALQENQPFALVFIDVRMPPGWDGLQTAKEIRNLDERIEIVIVTAYSDRAREEFVEQVKRSDKLLYLKKPFDPEEIRQLALSLTTKWDLEQRKEKHREYLGKVLNSVRRLKTLNISSVRGVLQAILSELLSFVHAGKGIVVKFEQDELSVEIDSDQISSTEIEELKTKVFGQTMDFESLAWVDSILVFPFKNGFGNYYILVSDIKKPVLEECSDLLHLLLETASEVLESVRLQEKYMQSEKIATIGQVAAGIIHELNNPLYALTGATELQQKYADKLLDFIEKYKEIQDGADPQKWDILEQKYDKLGLDSIGERLKRNRDIIDKGAEQIYSLMENIRNFSKARDELELHWEDLCEAMDSTLLLTHNYLKYGVTVHRNWQGPIKAQCDIHALNQVFLNLILNAVQAMQGKGELWISLKQENESVQVFIADSGPGISEKEKSRIFDPFYTSKADGTGLGLSIVKGIIDKHKGNINIDSAPGQGTTFQIEIPVEQV